MPETQPLALAVLDVNQTLFPLDPVAARLAEVGLGGELEPWFAEVLRDGIAAAAAGSFADFRDLAGHHVRTRLRRRGLQATRSAVDHVLGGFEEVVPHPDVAEGLATLRDAGVAAVALTNGSASVTRSFLQRAGLSDLVDGVHDVTEVGRWKPAPEPYRAILDGRGVPASAAVMVAVHPWDLCGARAVGLVTAWLDRSGEEAFPDALGSPDLRDTDLVGLARLIAARAHPR